MLKWQHWYVMHLSSQLSVKKTILYISVPLHPFTPIARAGPVSRLRANTHSGLGVSGNPDLSQTSWEKGAPA